MYILYTNTFVHSHRLNYPFDLFPSYWDKIAVLSQQDLISINSSVYHELAGEKKEENKDILQEWIEDVFQCVNSILSNDCPTMFHRRTSNRWE